MLGVTLTESEQAKTDKVDQKYRSKFWEPLTGEGGRLDIIDYVCPHCHYNLFFQLHSSTSCLHCGTPIFSAPRRKLDAKQHRNWEYDSFLVGMLHAKTRVSGSKTLRKASSGGRPGKSSKCKHDKWHTFPESPGDHR